MNPTENKYAIRNNKNNLIQISVLFFLAMTLTTCKKDHLLDCFKSAGSTTTQSRSAEAFENINLTDNVDLIIHPNSTPYIKVTAGSNLIDGIITELSGNTLYIRNENRCNWMRSFSNTYTVEVGMDKPVNLHYDGSGNISCIDTIKSDEFTFDCFNGSGTAKFIFNSNNVLLKNHIGRSDIHASGYSNNCYVYINDVGTLDASELISNNSYATNSSTGDCRLNVKNQLGIIISYNGNIYYSGNPVKIDQQISGAGKLIHI